MIQKTLSAKPAFFDTNPIGKIQTRFSKDVKVIDYDLPFVSNFVLTFLFKTIGIWILIAISVYYTIALFVVLIIAVLCLRHFVWKILQDIQRHKQISEERVEDKINQCVEGIFTIRNYGRFDHFWNEFKEAMDQNLNLMFTFNSVTRWFAFHLDIIGSVFVLLNSLVIVTVINKVGVYSPLLATIAIMHSFEMSYIISFIVRYFNELETCLKSTQRCVEYTQLESEDKFKKENDKNSWPKNAEIEFKNVTMRYRKGLIPSLIDVSFKINPKEKVGIIGRTGSGKLGIF